MPQASETQSALGCSSGSNVRLHAEADDGFQGFEFAHQNLVDEKTKEYSFGGFVLGCIEADFSM